MDSRFLRFLAEALEKGEPAVLVTVVDAAGSAPQEPGARLVVFPDGRTEGTVGGGALEHHAIRRALALLSEGPRTLLEPHDLRDLGMLCGGRATLFYEVLSAAPHLLIFGAGHVGRLLARLARETTTWRVVLVDDRPERLQDLPPGIESRHAPQYQALPELTGTVYAVVATESHATDLRVLRKLLAQERGPAYLGMLGSRTKAAELREVLLAEGIVAEKLGRVRSPVGLPLGGKDPGAVAISILAELLAFHHGRLAEARARLAG